MLLMNLLLFVSNQSMNEIEKNIIYITYLDTHIICSHNARLTSLISQQFFSLPSPKYASPMTPHIPSSKFLSVIASKQ